MLIKMEYHLNRQNALTQQKLALGQNGVQNWVEKFSINEKLVFTISSQISRIPTEGIESIDSKNELFKNRKMLNPGAEGPCEGSCPDVSFHKHYRTCSNGKCEGESVKNGRKCLQAEFTKRYGIEPITDYTGVLN